MFVVVLSLQNHYLKDVPFHNCTHAADVTQTSHTLLSAQAFEVSLYLVQFSNLVKAHEQFLNMLKRAVVFLVCMHLYVIGFDVCTKRYEPNILFYRFI